jgi:hypothetical protein
LGDQDFKKLSQLAVTSEDLAFWTDFMNSETLIEQCSGPIGRKKVGGMKLPAGATTSHIPGGSV